MHFFVAQVFKHQGSRLEKILKAAFSAIDEDGTGFLNQWELEVGLDRIAKELVVDCPTREQVALIMAALDDNGDGQISHRTLVSYM